MVPQDLQVHVFYFTDSCYHEHGCMGMRPLSPHLEQHEYESQDVKDCNTEHQPPKDRVRPNKGTVWHVYHTDQNEHHHHCNGTPGGGGVRET